MRGGVAVVAVLLATLGAACGPEARELSGFVRTPPPNVTEASLPDAGSGGSAFDMRADDDGLLVVYFGYTACPDVCPTTLADVRKALQLLGGDADRVTVAMVTIDPDRDTDEIVAAYVQSFVAGAHGLRTDDGDTLRAAADLFGADYEVTVGEDGEYEVIHTAHLYAVDDAGLLQVTWPFGTEPESLAGDIEILLEME